MAERVSTYVGSFAKRSGTGTQSITGVGFTPKAIFFWSVGRSAATGFETADQRLMFGVSDGTHHAAVSHASATGAFDTSSGHRNDAAFIIVDLDDSLNSAGVVSAVDADGFTFNWTTAAGHTGILINFLAIGGYNVQAFVGDVATSGSTGNQSVTGVGFRPSTVLFLAFPSSSSATSAASGFGVAGLGWMTSSGQGASSTTSFSGTRLRRYHRTDKCVAAKGYDGVFYDAEKVSFDVDGFTINWTTALAGRLAYLALRGVFTEAGTITAPAADGSETVEGEITAQAVLFVTNGIHHTPNTDDDANEYSVGAVDGAAHQRVAWSADRTGTGTTARYQVNTASIISANSNTSVTELQSSGDVTVETNGFSVDWTIPTLPEGPNQEEVLYLILGDSITPVDYEDPCEIEKPVMFVKVNTGTEVLKVGIKGIRDTASEGGYAEPRLLSMGPITRASSDPATGAFPAQNVDMRWADTDQETRDRSATRFGFRNADSEVYLTSLEQRVAGGPPRLLMAGKIRSNDHAPNLTEGFTINDLISVSYSLFAEEKLIPQRQIAVNWFPNAPAESVGLGEPIIGGRRAPHPTKSEGIVPTVLVGRLLIGGTPGTPTGTTLAAVVAALQVSVTAGTTDADWGEKIGHADAGVLEALGTVPSTYDALATVIGYQDLDALLAGEAVTGGTEYVTVVVAGHAIKEILDGTNSDPSIWIDDTQISAAEIGSTVFIDLSRDVLGADGTTRRYALIRFSVGSTYGDLVEAGGRVHVDCSGLETVGDSSGTLIEDAFSLYLHLLKNFILQDYQYGAWLDGPTFTFSDGFTTLTRLHEASFATASTIAQLQIAQGRLGSFTIGNRTPNRDVITKCNNSWGCLLAQDDYQRLFIKVLDTRRTEFYTNAFGDVHRVLRDKIDFLPGFWMEAKPDWQVNYLRYQYARNDYASSFERAAGGGGSDMAVYYQAGIDRDGLIEKLLTLDYVADDLTALTIAGNYRDLFANLPYVAHYARRGLCGLEDDVLDGLPIAHYNALGINGATGDAFWVLAKTYTNYHCEYDALFVEPLLTAIENPQPTALASSPVALRILTASQDSTKILITSA